MTEHKRVLIVDDQEFWRGEVRKTVKELGHEVVEAEDAQEAKELLAQQRFDLLITDNWMEGFNAGLELLSWNQERGKEMPSIIHTTSLSHVQLVRLAREMPDVIPVLKSTSGDHSKLSKAIRAFLA